ncbi:ribosome hibernation-promoting factor, HPF/YfiA family [uncultured Schumannella sp.]|jgi:ribosomal subunit interface protein|uniref:ribosome hibernation-promoting factor, HPF/YfiA family n=1 Tax=uncultured Schumannella sp. TaxID=1195956 RepID=UPI0025EA44EF|nr:ribosome-associated translation inhibitor RaiA [uncultured Schumannella sp.]
MDITITGRGVEVPDRFEDYATEKSEKIEKLAERALALEIKLVRHHESRGTSGDDRVEITLIGPGPLVRAEASAADKYAAFDLAFDKLVERIRQAKDRKKVHRGQHRPPSIGEAASNGRVGDVVPASVATLERVATGAIPTVEAEDEEDWSPVVIRRKVFPAERMTSAEALDRMELVGHDFFLFIDAETDRASVVYRRTGWDYGVIALDEESTGTDELAKARARRR